MHALLELARLVRLAQAELSVRYYAADIKRSQRGFEKALAARDAEIAWLRKALNDIQMHAVDVGPNVIIPAKQAIARATLEADRD